MFLLLTFHVFGNVSFGLFPTATGLWLFVQWSYSPWICRHTHHYVIRMPLSRLTINKMHFLDRTFSKITVHSHPVFVFLCLFLRYLFLSHFIPYIFPLYVHYSAPRNLSQNKFVYNCIIINAFRGICQIFNKRLGPITLSNKRKEKKLGSWKGMRLDGTGLGRKGRRKPREQGLLEKEEKSKFCRLRSLARFELSNHHEYFQEL